MADIIPSRSSAVKPDSITTAAVQAEAITTPKIALDAVNMDKIDLSSAFSLSNYGDGALTNIGTVSIVGGCTAGYVSAQDAMFLTATTTNPSRYTFLPFFSITPNNIDGDEIHASIELNMGAISGTTPGISWGFGNAAYSRLIYAQTTGAGGKFNIYSVGATGNDTGADGDAYTAGWHTLHMVINKTTRKIDLYIDGAATASATLTPAGGDFPSADELHPYIDIYSGATAGTAYFRNWKVWVE